MDIHKPKPAHSVREFIAELFTVVLGIVIAICLEQTVEYFHWRHEVEIGRTALTEEITVIDRFYARRIAIAPCLERRLDEDATRIRDIAANRKVVPQPLDPIRGAPGALLSDAEWQSERSSQTLTHFPRAELALMSQFYAQMGDMHDWIFEEQRAFSALNAMAEDPDHLGGADLAQLRVNLNVERSIEFLIVLNARRQLAISARLGIHYPPPIQVNIGHWCKPGESLGRLPG